MILSKKFRIIKILISFNQVLYHCLLKGLFKIKLNKIKILLLKKYLIRNNMNKQNNNLNFKKIKSKLNITKSTKILEKNKLKKINK